MSATPAAAPEQDALGDRPIALVLAPAPSRVWGSWTVRLGVVTFVSGAFLIVMFTSQALGRGTAPWGSINDTLGAAGNVILAVLVPYLSRGAAGTPVARWFVRLVVAACVAAAAAGLLLVTRLLSFESSTAISMVAIVVQCAWLIWLNRAWARHAAMPRRISRFGRAVGTGLLTAIALVAGSLLLPWGSLAANALLIPGVVLGSALWIAWPLWFILLGRHLTPAGADDQPGRATAGPSHA